MNIATLTKNLYAVLISFFFLFSYSVCAQEFKDAPADSNYKISPKILNVNFYKKDENYEVKGLEVVFGEFRYLSDYKKWKGISYNGRIVSFKNDNLAFFFIGNGLSIVKCEDCIDKEGDMIGGCRSIPEGELTVQMPYFPNGKYADIYDPSGKKVLTIDLSSKATCNENDKCDRPIEDGENCPQDCKNQEPKIDPVVVAQAQNQINSAENSASSNKWILIITAGIILVFAGLGFWLWRRYEKNKGQIYL